ncbi:DHA2 family efflux MFS transporter permease subunit [Nocardioides campestrisoli]|uniref:DHA2 family efflux MFS transporter permease subunit n=1 Tax=Nocardioides campestrisoli TaxID=2736757 RepID=UPI0015E727A6|nr:DHA2 family efflux MFS transporter permease subunit [Nocardioides campestrisoli]
MSAAAAVRWATPGGRGVLAAAVLGSGLTLLDGTVVNVALPAIGRDLGASLAQLQWVTNGYLLTLAGLVLLGGSLGDRFGRRRVFVVGTVWFAAASLLCGAAPSIEVLIAARLLQGVGGALLTPGSLAMIQGAFVAEDRARAIGAWSGLGGVATAVGPLLGGVLVDQLSWRWIFLVNLPLAVLTVLAAQRWVPETRDPDASGRFDVAGAVLASVALGGLTYALIEWGGADAVWASGIGVLTGVAFLALEHRARHPMVPLRLFVDRDFSAANAMTLLVYAALGAVLFFLVIQLQTVGGYSALAAGAGTLPVTVCMLLLASRGGALGARIGPRIPMTVGPLVMAVGTLMLVGAGEGSWWGDVLPGLTVFGLGLALMVAPLTATVLAAASDDKAGVASGINNAVARAGSLLAVAALPLAVGLHGDQYADPVAFDTAYVEALRICAGLLVAGGAVSWLAVRPVRGPGAARRSGGRPGSG